ncbi:MAG: argininosuccinate synthase [Deltaproteobacteria bacterium RIFOXYA12_FULL_58_15]|nr:MAG: argininosuccinate synthase [Deltaproteobacteria bacterium RIFOXYA12_FULL_58_15]
MGKEKVILAYSGGLDTSCILKWLQLKGYDVIAYVADVGQEEDFGALRSRALSTGAVDVQVVDLQREFVTDYIFPAIRGNAVYQGRYLLGTALARPVIAKHQVALAHRSGAKWMAHGATGKGNDQVRFELAFAALAPKVGVRHVWKDAEFLRQFQGRQDLIRFAKEQSIDIPVTLEKPFSTDENLMHKSYESGVLEDPMLQPDPNIFTVCKNPQDAPDRETLVEIYFKDGTPVRLLNLNDGREETEPLALFKYANEVAGENGVGRIDMVEDRFVGIKSRGIYETPGGTLLHIALRDLEGVAMDREVRRLRDMLAPELATIIYNGFWFSPEMDFLMGAIDKASSIIDGKVKLRLYKGTAMPIGRESSSSLYDKELSSMDIAGGFDQADSIGFIKVNSLRLKAHRLILRKVERI